MFWVKLASVFMFWAVALGAFGAHALRGKLDAYSLDVFKTAVFYHFIHALGLFIVAWLSTLGQDPKISAAGVFLSIGILLFSGSLYLISTMGWKFLGPVTPLGGLSFLIAWVLIFLAKVS